MCMKLVSIIIPVFNAEKYIERCVESLEYQTYRNIQIILVNDGSTDQTKKICESLVDKDNRIILLNKKNEGVSVARNIGLEHAKGEYITFLDSDDWVEKDYIYEMYQGFENEKVDIVCCNYFEETAKGAVCKMKYDSKVIDREEALNCFSSYYFTSVWGKLYKTEIIKDLRFKTDIFYSEDTLFYTEAVLRTEKIFWTNKPLYHYYINDSGALKNKNIDKFYTDFCARKKIVDLYKKIPELYEGAIYMALQSAISIKLEIAKQCEKKGIRYKELDDWIKENSMLGLRLATNNKDKIKILVCRYRIIYALINGIYKMKTLKTG